MFQTITKLLQMFPNFGEGIYIYFLNIYIRTLWSQNTVTPYLTKKLLEVVNGVTLRHFVNNAV